MVVAVADFETALDPMFQFQFQTMDAAKIASEIEVDVSGLLIPRHIVRDSVHPAFRMRLQFILERGQNPECSLDFFIRRLVHGHSSPEVGSEKVSLGHKMHVQS